MFYCFWNQSVQSLTHVRLFVTSWTAARQASLSATNSQCLLKLMSIELVMPSNHLILCRPLLLPSIFPSIRVFSNESVLHIRWPKYWSFRFSPSNEYSGLISFRIDWFDLLAVQGTLKNLLPTSHFKSINSKKKKKKASILLESALAYLLFYRVRAGTGWRGSVPYYTMQVSIFNPPSHFLGFCTTICFFFALQQNLRCTSLGSPFPQPSSLC